MSPDNSIRSNNNHQKHGVNVKNHLGIPLKSQGYDINGATTNATSATNGTTSG